MRKFKVGIVVPRGSRNTSETVVELPFEDVKELEATIWNLLENAGVETWWAEVEELEAGE